jgi:hypothetical protein
LAKFDEPRNSLEADAVYHGHPPGSPSRPERTMQFAVKLRSAFPDLHATVDDVMAITFDEELK